MRAAIELESPPVTLKVIRFTVLGRARPQGSKRHVGRGVMVESSKALKPWRQDVAGMASYEVAGSMPFAAHVPVKLSLDFYFAAPKKCKRAGMTTKPDASKLARAIEDSLTGIVFHDDAQVVQLLVRKFYGTPERVEIEVREA